MSESPWRATCFASALKLEYGVALPERERMDGRVPVFGSNGRVGNHHAYAVQGPGIVVGRKGTVGAVTWSEVDFWPIDTAYYVVTMGPELRWLFHSLCRAGLRRLDSSTGVPGLNREDVYRIKIQLPPLPEQRAIAAVLDSLDDAIQKTEQIIAKLQQVKQGLLHDLLTRGIDDNGELRDPDRHPEQFQDSPLGRIPKGWRVGSIGEFCEVYNYLREPISEELRAQKPGPFPYYGPTGILDHINEWRVEGEFVLIGEDGDHFLKFASWPMTQLVRGRFNVNNHAHILCGKPDCRTHWVDTFFRHRDITLHTTRQGAGRFKLNKAALLTLPILVPSLLEQDHITTHFQTVESRIAADGRRLTKLQNLKAGLSDDLLTGRVRTTSLPGFSA